MTRETADHQLGDSAAQAEPLDGNGSAVTDQHSAHDAIDELRQADADYVAGKTVSGEELRTRYGLTSATGSLAWKG